MKLLEVYPGGFPSEYRDLFEGEGIRFSEKALRNTFVNMGRIHTPTNFQVFVSEEDYDKALNAIKSYEMQMEQKVEIDSKEADGVMLRILIGAFCVVGLIVLYLGNKAGWW